jgi:hypothetical protein
MDVFVPSRQSRATRPVDDEELLLLRTASMLNGDSRSGVVLALAETTAVTSEITQVRIKDLDDPHEPKLVQLSGTARHQPRQGQLTAWGSQMIGRWVEKLRAAGCAQDALLAYGGMAPAGGAKAQASVGNALGELIRSVALDEHDGIRPGSIRAGVGRRIFETDGLAVAATALGLSSLDQAALVIDYQWPHLLQQEAN